MLSVEGKSREELLKKYGKVGEFRDGLAVAEKGFKMFHIRPDGTQAYSARFDMVRPFKNCLALVREGGLYFHIRPDGTPAYDTRFGTVVYP